MNIVHYDYTDKIIVYIKDDHGFYILIAKGDTLNEAKLNATTELQRLIAELNKD